MRQEYGFKDNFNIAIHKEIPFAAGLGGGSSNAAAVMMALVSLLHIKADPAKLNQIGLSIGADVPFFLLNKPAYVTGIGEKLQLIPVKKSYNCLIVKPQKGLSTTDVFAVADNFERTAIETQGVLQALASGDNALLAKSIGNDLYAPAKSLLPEVGKIVDSLKNDGISIVCMLLNNLLSITLSPFVEAPSLGSPLEYISISVKKGKMLLIAFSESVYLKNNR